MNVVSTEKFIEKLGIEVYPITIIKFLLNRKKILSYFNRAGSKNFELRGTKYLLDNGWIEETKALLAQGISLDSPGMNAIGYREICKYLSGDMDEKALFEEIARKTRNYAKRQLTWFNNRAGFEKIYMSFGEYKAADYILKLFIKTIPGFLA